MGNNSIFYTHCFLSTLPNIRPSQPEWLETQCYIFSHDSVLHYLFLSVPWTLDLWFDVLLPNSRPISPILLNQYVHWRMFTLTDCGWQKSTQTFAGCPFNNPFVYRGWGDAAGLGDTIPISIKGELSQGWGWNRVHIKRHLYLHVFEIMETVLENSFATGCLCWTGYDHDIPTINYLIYRQHNNHLQLIGIFQVTLIPMLKYCS